MCDLGSTTLSQNLAVEMSASRAAQKAHAETINALNLDSGRREDAVSKKKENAISKWEKREWDEKVQKAMAKRAEAKAKAKAQAEAETEG